MRSIFGEGNGLDVGAVPLPEAPTALRPSRKGRVILQRWTRAYPRRNLWQN